MSVRQVAFGSFMKQAPVHEQCKWSRRRLHVLIIYGLLYIFFWFMSGMSGTRVEGPPGPWMIEWIALAERNIEHRSALLTCSGWNSLGYWTRCKPVPYVSDPHPKHKYYYTCYIKYAPCRQVAWLTEQDFTKTYELDSSYDYFFSSHRLDGYIFICCFTY